LADLTILRRLIYDDKKALDLLDEALKNPVGNPTFGASSSIVDNVHNKERPTGNSIEAALRRLRSDGRNVAGCLYFGK
jgi:hypothetical protein